jgi:hypothetical protein
MRSPHSGAVGLLSTLSSRPMRRLDAPPTPPTGERFQRAGKSRGPVLVRVELEECPCCDIEIQSCKCVRAQSLLPDLRDSPCSWLSR